MGPWIPRIEDQPSGATRLGLVQLVSLFRGIFCSHQTGISSHGSDETGQNLIFRHLIFVVIRRGVSHGSGKT